MGILNFVKSQFIEVIEWLDPTQDTIVYRFPVQGQEIKMGAQLVVRESQQAVFINQGALTDVFSPGTHTLSTQNLPVLTKLNAWKYGFNSPFKAEVYFVSTKLFTDRKWGTSNPVLVRDAEFGAVRLRAFGAYSFRVKDAGKFVKEVSGTDGNFETEEIEGQIKRTLVSSFTDLVAEAKVALLDLASRYDELGQAMKDKLAKELLESYGLELAKFIIENVSMPPELEAVMDQRIKMNILGDPNRYMQFQVADAIPLAAQTSNSGLGLGMGLGGGLAMAGAVGGMVQQSLAPPPMAATPAAASASAAPAATQAGAKFCSNCGTALAAGAKFCAECGSKIG
jgi:membrane protease subunit (stomatin/prohibitin family)